MFLLTDFFNLSGQTRHGGRLEQGAQFDCQPTVLDGTVRLEQANGHQWIARLVEAFPGKIDSVTLGKPTLEDVFIGRTGHRFWQATDEAAPSTRGR